MKKENVVSRLTFSNAKAVKIINGYLANAQVSISNDCGAQLMTFSKYGKPADIVVLSDECDNGDPWEIGHCLLGGDDFGDDLTDEFTKKLAVAVLYHNADLVIDVLRVYDENHGVYFCTAYNVFAVPANKAALTPLSAFRINGDEITVTFSGIR